jgi:PAS domain S-box-containing protein
MPSVFHTIRRDTVASETAALRVQLEALQKENQALKQKAEMFEIILEQMQEAVTVLDSQGKGLIANRRAKEITGNLPDNLPPADWVKLIQLYHTDQVTPYAPADIPLFRSLAYGESFPFLEGWLKVASSNNLTFLRGSCTPLKSATGEILGVVTVFRDATPEYRQEELLRASEARFRLMADSTPILIWMTNVDREATYFNRTWLHFTGRTLEQELGKGWQAGIHPDDFGQFSQTVLTARESYKPWELEYRLRRYDGQYRWILDHGQPRFTDTGAFKGYVGTCLDITERIQAEQSLSEEQARFDLVVRGAAVGVWEWKAATNQNYFSQRFCQILGFLPEEIEHTLDTFADLLHPEDRARVSTAVNLHLTKRVPYEIEYRLRTKSGDYKWMHASGQAVWDEAGRPVRMAGTVADITHRKLIEEALRESNALLEQKVQESTVELKAANTLLQQEMYERSRIEQERVQLQRDLAEAEEQQRRHIARELHDELGQLIVGMKLGLRQCSRSLSEDSPLSPRFHQLESIAEAIDHAAHQVARKLRPTALDDQGLLPALVDLLDEWSRQAFIEVDWQAAEFRDEEFSLAAKSALYRTVQEALTNILKHAKATRVSVILDRKPDNIALLIVEDNGQGYDVEAVDSHTNQRMGLRGMRERVELAGGEIAFESSASGGGTTIYVRLPLTKTELIESKG